MGADIGWKVALSGSKWFYIETTGPRLSPCIAYWRGYYEVWEDKPGLKIGDEVVVHSRHIDIGDAKAAAEVRMLELDAPAKPVQGTLL